MKRRTLDSGKIEVPYLILKKIIAFSGLKNKENFHNLCEVP